MAQGSAARKGGADIEDRRRRWVDSALAGLIADIRGAGQGGRNAALNAAAHRAGRLIAGGHLGQEQAAAALQEAAREAGMGELEARSTIRSGMSAGLAAGPAELPAELREQGRTRPRPAAPASERTPPPAAEVRVLWMSCTPVWGTPQGDELAARGLDASAIEDLDLARVLLLAGLPRWARSAAGPWSSTGHRLALRLYDVRGALASVHARRLAPGDGPKGLSPAGYATRGLVLADATALDLLAAGPPPWWNGQVLLTEGVPGWLALACRPSDAAEQVPAVMGYLQGSWTPEIAARIPQGARVTIWPHDDDAGGAMSAKIGATLAHCDVYYAREDAHGPRA